VRVEPDDPEPLPYEQACAYRAQAMLLQPENRYRLEPVPDPDSPLTQEVAHENHP
jgi:hypothetical protein